MEPLTIDDFIKQLQAISENKRKLPLVIYAPNGLECSPTVKMGYEGMYNILTSSPTKMVITYK